MQTSRVERRDSRTLARVIARLGTLLLTSLALLSTPVCRAAPKPDFTFGLCAHLASHKEAVDRSLDLFKQLGVASVRDDAPWERIESLDGKFVVPESWDRYVDRARAQGIEPLLILDYGHQNYDAGEKPRSPAGLAGFAHYAERLATHFRGRVHWYEVWNEWNAPSRRFKAGSAQDYVALLRAVYPVLKGVDPSIQVFAGAMTPAGIRGERLDRLLQSVGIESTWLLDMLKAGGLQYSDRLSLHTYIYERAGKDREPEAWLNWMSTVEDQIRKYNGGKEVPLYITEMGWPSHSGPHGSSTTDTASYLARMYLLARTQAWLRGVWWYDLLDDGPVSTDKEQNFGLVRVDYQPKPAFAAYAEAARILTHATFINRADLRDPELYVLRFRAETGEDRVVAWQTAEPAQRLILELTGRTPSGIRLRMLSGSPQALQCEPAAAGNDGTVCRIEIGKLPVVVEGNLSGTRLRTETRSDKFAVDL